MRSHTCPLLVSVATGAALLLATGCSSSPTYRKEHLANSLQGLFAAEHLQTSVRFLDHTLAVQLQYPGALRQDGDAITIGPAFDEVLRKVLPGMHRVLLSTDADVQFYVLLVSDPATPRAYLTMVRYMDDVRRANANMLDTPEMFSRTVFDLKYAGERPVTIEQYVPRDIQMEEFLSWQLARRIQTSLAQELQVAGLADVGPCGGEFHDGEFAFTLNVSPIAEGTLGEDTLQAVFQTATRVVAKVLSSYRFESFESIRLILPVTGRNLVLPKARLEIFR